MCRNNTEELKDMQYSLYVNERLSEQFMYPKVKETLIGVITKGIRKSSSGGLLKKTRKNEKYFIIYKI
jgi:hypothetical protein